MGYWQAKVVPKFKQIFDKNGPKKAAAAEACKTFDEAKVEEEMLMRKFYELMSAHGLNKKKGFKDNADERQNGLQGVATDVTNGADERQNGLEGAIINMMNGDH